MTISKQIEKIIENSPIGSTFVITDFLNISSYEAARKALSRLESTGKIKKAERGTYYKAGFSELLGEPIAPNINNIADAIARNNDWNITPSGENALNLLGISTQVPARYCYISSGPYRKYTIGNTEIEFLHRSDKELNGKTERTRLIIQACKAIGKERINDYIPKFKSALSENDKQTILKEGQRTTLWINQAFKEIAKE